MPSKQRILFGGTVERSLNGTTWTRIEEVTAFGLPAVTTDYQEVTSLDSTGGFKEYVKGLKDVSDISIECGYVTATYETALSDQALTAPVKYRFTLPRETGQATTGDRFTVDAFPTVSTNANAIGEVVTLEISLKVTGGFIWTKGA